jgi:molecular chaperone GrpE (heat shock protein)
MEEGKKKKNRKYRINHRRKIKRIEDKYLRLYAEFENYKKRINKQKERFSFRD